MWCSVIWMLRPLRPAIHELRSALSSIVQAIQSVKEEPARWAGLLSDLGSSGNGQISRGAGPTRPAHRGSC